MCVDFRSRFRKNENDKKTQMTQTPNAATTFVVGDGFLPPGKSTGSVTQVLRNLTTGNFDVAKLTRDKTDWFYHRVVWADVNADGLLDIVTARAYDSVLSGGRGELIWLEVCNLSICFPLGGLDEPCRNSTFLIGATLDRASYRRRARHQF